MRFKLDGKLRLNFVKFFLTIDYKPISGFVVIILSSVENENKITVKACGGEHLFMKSVCS